MISWFIVGMKQIEPASGAKNSGHGGLAIFIAQRISGFEQREVVLHDRLAIGPVELNSRAADGRAAAPSSWPRAGLVGAGWSGRRAG